MDFVIYTIADGPAGRGYVFFNKNTLPEEIEEIFHPVDSHTATTFWLGSEADIDYPKKRLFSAT